MKVPQQTNSVDCGCFVLSTMRVVLSQEPFTPDTSRRIVTQRKPNVPNIRSLMARWLFKCQAFDQGGCEQFWDLISGSSLASLPVLLQWYRSVHTSMSKDFCAHIGYM